MQNVENSFKCPLCFFVSDLQTELVKHYLRIHKNDERFKVKCQLCNRVFTKTKSLNQHSRRGGCINNSNEDDDHDNCYGPVNGTTENNFQIEHNMDQEDAGEIFSNVHKY